MSLVAMRNSLYTHRPIDLNSEVLACVDGRTSSRNTNLYTLSEASCNEGCDNKECLHDRELVERTRVLFELV